MCTWPEDHPLPHLSKIVNDDLVSKLQTVSHVFSSKNKHRLAQRELDPLVLVPGWRLLISNLRSWPIELCPHSLKQRGKQSANETANQQVRATKPACRPVISLSNADLSCFIQLNSGSTAIHQWYHTSKHKIYNKMPESSKTIGKLLNALVHTVLTCELQCSWTLHVILEIQQDIS